MIIKRDNFRNSFLIKLDGAGIKQIKSQELKHTYTTLLLKQGVNSKITCESLGHSDISFILKIYFHVLPNI